jgi:hypothetical protein
MKTAALWDMKPCSLVKCANVLDDPVVSIITGESSEMLAHSYQTTRHYIPDAFRYWAHKAHDLWLHTTNTIYLISSLMSTAHTQQHNMEPHFHL